MQSIHETFTSITTRIELFIQGQLDLLATIEGLEKEITTPSLRTDQLVTRMAMIKQLKEIQAQEAKWIEEDEAKVQELFKTKNWTLDYEDGYWSD